MAFINATATDFKDLLAQVKIFATQDTALIASGQAWVINRDITGAGDHELLLQGPGISNTVLTLAAGNNTGNGTLLVTQTIGNDTAAAGVAHVSNGTSIDRYAYSSFTGSAFTLDNVTLSQNYAAAAEAWVPKDQIYGGMSTFESVPSDYYNWKVAGHTGFVSSNTFDTQPGTSGSKTVPMWNQSIEYWLAVNGRRIVMAAKVNTVYMMFYMGFIHPYARPDQYPYPFYIGAMLNGQSATRFSASNVTNGLPDGQSSTNRLVREISGSWLQHSTWPYAQMSGNPMRTTGTEYPLNRIVLSRDGLTGEIYGTLDGVFHVSGFGGNASENDVVLGGDTYRVFQDAYRNGTNDYFAIKEE